MIIRHVALEVDLLEAVLGIGGREDACVACAGSITEPLLCGQQLIQHAGGVERVYGLGTHFAAAFHAHLLGEKVWGWDELQYAVLGQLPTMLEEKMKATKCPFNRSGK